jgi:hypothetical protein
VTRTGVSPLSFPLTFTFVLLEFVSGSSLLSHPLPAVLPTSLTSTHIALLPYLTAAIIMTITRRNVSPLTPPLFSHCSAHILITLSHTTIQLSQRR